MCRTVQQVHCLAGCAHVQLSVWRMGSYCFTLSLLSCAGAWFRGLEEGAAAAAASAANAAANTIDSSSSWLDADAAALGSLQLQAAGQLVPATAAAGSITAGRANVESA